MKILLLNALFSLSTVAVADSAADFARNKNALTALQYIHSVAIHPRCVNCHGTLTGGRHIPTVGDDMKPHPMKIDSSFNTSKANGTDCSSCHQKFNVKSLGAPPGASNHLLPNFLWHMPPATMMIRPNITSRDLCLQWMNPKNTGSELEPDRGGRNDLSRFQHQFIDEHVVKDPLIIWGWNPGGERKSLPGSHALFVNALRVWVQAGAPCQ